MTTIPNILDHHALPQLLRENKCQIIDVRSPKEFDIDHIPTAINLPVLNNDEHHEIGKEYIQESKPKAKRRAAALIARNIADYLDHHPLFDNFKTPFLITCYRGGQRSQAFAHILKQIGYHVSILEGGYKSYRQQVQMAYNTPPLAKGLTVYGPSGTGKTRLLRTISQQENIPFMDFEHYANHRGSRFGGLGLNPRNQKNFETHIWQFITQLPEKNSHILVEGESRHVGKSLIPKPLFEWMTSHIKIWVELPLELRAHNLVEDYFGSHPSQDIIDGFIQITQSLEEEKGQKFTKKIINKIQQSQYIEAACVLLTELFDPLYNKCKINDPRDTIDITATSNQELENKLTQKIKELLSV